VLLLNTYIVVLLKDIVVSKIEDRISLWSFLPKGNHSLDNTETLHAVYWLLTFLLVFRKWREHSGLEVWSEQKWQYQGGT
jgi:hypothetical protein